MPLDPRERQVCLTERRNNSRLAAAEAEAVAHNEDLAIQKEILCLLKGFKAKQDQIESKVDRLDGTLRHIETSLQSLLQAQERDERG